MRQTCTGRDRARHTKATVDDRFAWHRFKKSHRTALLLGAKADKNAMEANMNEHRDLPGQNIEQKIEQLVRCITLLEACNAILHDKLARAAMKLSTLERVTE